MNKLEIFNLIYSFVEMENDYLSKLKGKAIVSMNVIKSGQLKIKQNEIKRMVRSEERKLKDLEFTEEIMNHYAAVCLFNDSETKKGLLELGLSEEDLYWLMNFEVIKYEIEKINETGKYYILQSLAIFNLELYLSLRIKVAVINNFKPSSRQTKMKINFQFIKQELINYKRNAKNRNKTKKIKELTDFEFLVKDLKLVGDTICKSLYNFQDFESVFQALDNQNLHKILKRIYYDTLKINPDKMFSAQEMRLFYPLYYRLLPDKKLYANEIEFKKMKDKELGEGEGFKRFQFKFLRRFLKSE